MVLLDYIAEQRGMRIPREAGSDPDLWAQLRSARGNGGEVVGEAVALRIAKSMTSIAGTPRSEDGVCR